MYTAHKGYVRSKLPASIFVRIDRPGEDAPYVYWRVCASEGQ